MKAVKLFAAVVVGAAFQLWAAVPSVSNVHMSEATDSREVTITYDLDAAAVVTLDVQTNAIENAGADDPGWTSIGGEAVWNAWGDVWKKVNTNNNASFTGTIKWRPDLSWPGHRILGHGARAKVTAWSLDNTPNYMVVDLTLEKTQDGFITYFPGADYLPKKDYDQTGAAVTNNADYKTTKLLMRKVMAAGVKWTMGSTSDEKGHKGNEITHAVTLADNYYIGVFEITQKQWAMLGMSSNPSRYQTAGEMRPIEQASFTVVRNATPSTAVEWPSDPDADSFIYRLRHKTGLDFDLPSEAQWEFAARAGNGSPRWGDGSVILATTEDANLDKHGRYERNGGKIKSGTSYADPAVSCGPTNGTAVVGSYAPNAWGLYDMSGNVFEWCLDWYAETITTYEGAVNINSVDARQTLSEATGTTRVIRGGCWFSTADKCRPAYRLYRNPTLSDYPIGVRIVCAVGLR